MGAVLNEEPADIATCGRGLPPRSGTHDRRCLEKNPANRFQSAHDLRFALDISGEPRPRACAPPGLSRAVRAAGPRVRLAIVASAMTADVMSRRTASKRAGDTGTSILPPEKPFGSDPVPALADGRTIAFTAPNAAGRR